MQSSYRLITLILIVGITSLRLSAQDIPVAIDSTAFDKALDSANYNAPSSIVKNDTVKRDGDVKTKIDYSARDSITFDLVTNDIYLYGKTSVEYGSIKLTSAKTKINWRTKIMEATYYEDSTGRKLDKPVFTDNGESYEASKMNYNFQTKKAYIYGIITKQGDAFMQGDEVKKSGDELYIKDAKYTTCNLSDPHFHIASKKLKVIPGNKVVSGPFYMAFREIKSPLGFFFGMFPQPNKKSSGVIIPSYGEQRTQGFFLRDGGVYLKFNDYIDARITGDIYTSGAHGLRLNSNYRSRYAYNGSLNFNYNFQRQFSVVENPPSNTGFSFSWSHSPKNYGTSRFSSNVNIQTNSYNATSNNAIVDLQRSVQSSFASNVSYSKNFRNTPFSLSATLRHKQTLETRTVDVTLPEMNLSTKRQFPFKKIKGLEKGVLGKLGFSHNFTARNNISNKAKNRIPGINQINRDPEDDSLLVFNADNIPQLLERAQIGGIHRIPISTSFNLFKYITVSPSASYTEVWYPKQLQYSNEYDTAANGYEVNEINRFSRAGWYNLSTSLSTRLYGFAYFKKGKIKAIRHVVNPNISLGYSPDFSRSNAFQRVINENGQEVYLSKFAGFTQGGPPTSQSANLSFGLTNNIEMKVVSKKDTITGTKKISLFDNLSFNSGYNILADSFRLNNISMRAATSLFDRKVTLSVNGTLNPYTYVLDGEALDGNGDRNRGRQINQLRWFNGGGLGQLQRLSATIATSFAPPGAKKKERRDFSDTESTGDPQLDYILSNPDQYIDFKIPWNLSLNYNIAYSKIGFEEGRINTNSLSARGDVSLTPKTKVTFGTGYNFDQKLIQPTNLGIIRDLHCWSLSFNVIPFGVQQSFNLRINAKSSILQDLKLEKRRSWLDN